MQSRLLKAGLVSAQICYKKGRVYWQRVTAFPKNAQTVAYTAALTDQDLAAI